MFDRATRVDVIVPGGLTLIGGVLISVAMSAGCARASASHRWRDPTFVQQAGFRNPARWSGTYRCPDERSGHFSLEGRGRVFTALLEYDSLDGPAAYHAKGLLEKSGVLRLHATPWRPTDAIPQRTPLTIEAVVDKQTGDLIAKIGPSCRSFRWSAAVDNRRSVAHRSANGTLARTIGVDARGFINRLDTAQPPIWADVAAGVSWRLTKDGDRQLKFRNQTWQRLSGNKSSLSGIWIPADEDCSNIVDALYIPHTKDDIRVIRRRLRVEHQLESALLDWPARCKWNRSIYVDILNLRSGRFQRQAQVWLDAWPLVPSYQFVNSRAPRRRRQMKTRGLRGTIEYRGPRFLIGVRPNIHPASIKVDEFSALISAMVRETKRHRRLPPQFPATVLNHPQYGEMTLRADTGYRFDAGDTVVNAKIRLKSRQCGTPPPQYASLSFGDALFAIETQCQRDLEPRELLSIAGLVANLSQRCALPKNPADRSLLSEFLTSASLAAAYGTAYSTRPLQKALGSQLANSRAFIEGGTYAKILSCKTPRPRIMVSNFIQYIKRTRDPKARNAHWVRGCTAYYGGRFGLTEDKCQCMADVGRAVFPNIHRKAFDRGYIKNITQRNPLIGGQMVFQCGVIQY